jgi:hypothetical protein
MYIVGEIRPVFMLWIKSLIQALGNPLWVLDGYSLCGDLASVSGAQSKILATLPIGFTIEDQAMKWALIHLVPASLPALPGPVVDCGGGGAG